MKNVYEKALMIFVFIVALFFGYFIHESFGLVGIIIAIIIPYFILFGIPNLIEIIKKKKKLR